MIRYALAWVAVGSLTALVLIAALRGDDSGDGGTVSLPPVRATQLESAARAAGCRLERAKPRERLNPPVDGPPGAPAARPAVYDRAPAAGALIGAVRRGIVVIQYRPGLARKSVEQLQTLQRAVPTGTIVTPNATSMPFEFAVIAYRRLLGCGRYSAKTIDAVRLFRGRYLGRGPDRRP